MDHEEDLAREKVYMDLRLPPFASAEPIQRFEALTNIVLPDDLRLYVQTVSREFIPQALQTATRKPRLGLAFLYEPGPALLSDFLAEDEKVGGRQDALPRLCPLGTLRRELFDRISGGVCPWKHENIVPYLIAYEQLVHDPTQGVANMKTEVRKGVPFVSLANSVKRCAQGGARELFAAEQWLAKVVAATGMTQEELCFADAEVDVLILCHDYGNMFTPVLALVTSSGPYHNWYMGWHRVVAHDAVSIVASAFPSLSKFCRFIEHQLDRGVILHEEGEPSESDVQAAASKRQEQLNEVLRLVLDTSQEEEEQGEEERIDDEYYVSEGSSADADDGQQGPPNLVLPPFSSEEPVVRFETAAGVRLPEDLRSYLLNESREYPIEDNTSKSHTTAMLYRVCPDFQELLLFEDEYYEPAAFAARLLRPGSHEKDVYDRAHASRHTVPYYLAHADLQRDPSGRTTKMRETRTSRRTLTCLAQSALCDAEDGLSLSVDFVNGLLALTDMTVGQLVFPSCEVDALPLSRWDTGYAEMALVTTPGPYQNWIIGTHIMNYGHFSAGFPSFTAYRQFYQSVMFSYGR